MSQPWTHTAGAKAYPRVDEHYVEPTWCSLRLFEEETFHGHIYDPCCGFGRIIAAARAAGYRAGGSDIVDRGGCNGFTDDFFEDNVRRDNFVFNPPFNIAPEFILHALSLAYFKVAAVFPVARLNAARWLEETPLQTIWLLTPRPSMPPGHVIASGGKVGGGKSDYCWLVFERKHRSPPELRWLRRDKP